MARCSRERSAVVAFVVRAPSISSRQRSSPRETPLLTRHRGWSARTPSTGNRRAVRAHRRPVRRRHRAAPRRRRAAIRWRPVARALLKEEELRAIEGTYPHGITAVQIVDAFTSRGIKFSEASFRKYVQQGLLPRSRRVGRKGKHRGSLGVTRRRPSAGSTRSSS